MIAYSAIILNYSYIELVFFLFQIHSVWIPSPVSTFSLILFPFLHCCVCNTTVRGGSQGYSGLSPNLPREMCCSSHCQGGN